MAYVTPSMFAEGEGKREAGGGRWEEKNITHRSPKDAESNHKAESIKTRGRVFALHCESELEQDRRR